MSTITDYREWATAPKGDNAFAKITNAVSRVIEAPKPPPAWYVAMAVALCWLTIFGVCVGYLFWEGIGIWGNMHPVAWGWPIVNFVFWVGIGHEGKLISPILFLFRQNRGKIKESIP